MEIAVRPSDLFYRYRRVKATRDAPKFAGLPDSHLFDRDDLYEVIPMLEAVMTALGSSDGRVLHRAEEVMVQEMPDFVQTRGEVFDYLVHVMRDVLEA